MDKEKIREKIKELEALLEEPEDTKNTDFRLKLNTGVWYYLGHGFITNDSYSHSSDYLNTFNAFATKEQTGIAVKRMSAQNELLQMAFILNGDWKPDFTIGSEKKYDINFDHTNNNFYSSSNSIISFGAVCFKKDPFNYFIATASDNLKSYIKGEFQ